MIASPGSITRSRQTSSDSFVTISLSLVESFVDCDPAEVDVKFHRPKIKTQKEKCPLQTFLSHFDAMNSYQQLRLQKTTNPKRIGFLLYLFLRRIVLGQLETGG